MTAIRKAKVQRQALRPTRIPDVDDEPLTAVERQALEENDGTFTNWEDLKAELKL